MIDHFGIICADYGKSKEFYDAVLGVLGYARQMDVGPAIGYGRDGKPDFWIEDGDGRQVGCAVHFAFQAASTDEVKAFYDAALEARRRVAARAAALARVSPRLLRCLRPRSRRQQRRGRLPRSVRRPAERQTGYSRSVAVMADH